MSAMRFSAAPPAQPPDGALVPRLIRLVEEVAALNRQLERLETKTHELLRRSTEDRFREYC